MAATLVTISGCSTKRIGECHPGYEPPDKYEATYQDDVGKTIFRAAINSQDDPDSPETSVSHLITTSLEKRLERNRNSGDPRTKQCVAGDLRALVLSTGGAWGAFGAGFLEGISNSDKPYFDVCPYDLVTGSSTGAIIAPLAFLGSQRDLRKASQIYREQLTDANTVERRSLPAVYKNGALFNTAKLRSLVRRTLADEEYAIVDRLAEEAAKDRVLLVSAVNLDTSHLEIFNLTAIANSDISKSERTEKIAQAITASAAIPIAFDPITIDACLYHDSALRTNTFMSGELVALIAKANGAPVTERDNRYGGREFVIDMGKSNFQYFAGIDLVVNGRADLGRWENTKKFNVIDLALRDFGTLLNQSMLSSVGRIRDASALMGWTVRYQDAIDYEGEPASSPLSASGAAFDSEFLADLNDHGRSIGLKTDLSERWKAIPPPVVPTFVDPAEK
jgi:hypothetical protein